MWAIDRSATLRRSFVAAVVPLLAVAPLRAQPPSPVTDADIARAAASQPKISDDDIARAARKHRMPTEAELARVPVPTAPRIEALPQPQVKRQIDLGAIAGGYEAMGKPTPGAILAASGPALLVFVSFAMPEASLTRLVDQASRAGATLVLRGLLDGSLQRTVVRVQSLIGQRKVAFQIDPQAFDRFSVTTTPTFVVLKQGAMPAPCTAGTCFPADSFVSVAGDVSVGYALEFLMRSKPAFSADAGAMLAKLRGTP